MAQTLRNQNDKRPRLEYYPINSPTLRTVVVESYPFIIGRGETAQLQIKSESISREHAELTRTSSGFLLRDLNSTNGTAINGQPISTAQLEDGDIVSIAETKLTFLCSASGPLERMVTQPLGARQKLDPKIELAKEIVATRELAEALLWQAIPLKRDRVVDPQSGAEHAVIVSIDVPLASRLRASESPSICSTASRIQQLAWQLAAEHADEVSTNSILMRVELQTQVDHRLCGILEQAYDCLSGSQTLGVILPWEWAVQSPTTLALCAELRELGAVLAFDRFAGGATCIGDMQQASPDYLVLAPSVVRGISTHPRRMTQLMNLVSACAEAEIEPILPNGLPEEDRQASCDLGIDLIVNSSSTPVGVSGESAVVAAV